MKPFIYHAGSVESHKSLGQWAKQLEDGKAWLIQAKENKPVRSNDQNRFYFAILKIICSEAGLDNYNDLHEVCKFKFNGGMIVTKRGNQEWVGKSTSRLNTKEFSAYVNRVKNWAREEWDVIIPESEQADERFYSMVDDRYEKIASGF